MRSQENIVVGLDIGTTKICVLAAEQDSGGSLNVVGFGQARSEGIAKGVVVDIEKTVAAIQQAVRECELMSGTQIKEVYAGIAGHHIQGMNSHGMVMVNNNRTVTEDDISRVIDAAQAVNIPNDREVLHILPQGFIVDDQDGVQNPLGMSGIRLEVDVHIVTCGFTAGQNIVKCCKMAGLDVADIVLEPLASSQAVLSQDERELGVVLVDIGGGTTDIAMYSNGSIVHTSVLALGGNQLTKDIAIGLSTPMPEAEMLKHQHGVASTNLVKFDEMVQVPSVGGRRPRTLDKRVLAEVIEPRFKEIFRFVNERVERSGYRNVVASGVVITGGSSLMPGVDDLASEIMQFPVRVGFPENVTGLTEMIHSPMHATGVGLLRYALGNGEYRHTPLLSGQQGIFNKVGQRMKDFLNDFF